METIILWLIIGLAAVYAGRALIRIIQGKSKGCGCNSSPCSPSSPQQILPDFRSEDSEEEPPLS
ncbi:MAG: FeoB-associated Cys-rich membrane protein [Proteobacteria bacterium]|nr:FeoB-associated Cys-rich membrane protein [Pseudomonadota bacterium]MBU1688090.1 FeoB-associated Cys-rich membrane protein [Pseudomonadota bacterium]